MVQYQPLANGMAMTHRSKHGILVSALVTPAMLPIALLESLRILALQGIKISLPKLQRVASIGPVRIAKEVTALPIPSWSPYIFAMLPLT